MAVGNPAISKADKPFSRRPTNNGILPPQSSIFCRVPAVIYGGKKDAVLISLDPVELEKALDLRDFYKSEIVVDVEGKKVKTVCQDVQFHPVSDKPIHVDFMRK